MHLCNTQNPPQGRILLSNVYIRPRNSEWGSETTGVGFLYAVVIPVADCPADQTINDQSQDNPFSRRHTLRNVLPSAVESLTDLT